MNFNKKNVIVSIIIILAIVGSYLYFQKRNNTQSSYTQKNAAPPPLHMDNNDSKTTNTTSQTEVPAYCDSGKADSPECVANGIINRQLQMYFDILKDYPDYVQKYYQQHIENNEPDDETVIMIRMLSTFVKQLLNEPIISTNNKKAAQLLYNEYMRISRLLFLGNYSLRFIGHNNCQIQLPTSSKDPVKTMIISCGLLDLDQVENYINKDPNFTNAINALEFEGIQIISNENNKKWYYSLKRNKLTEIKDY